MANYSNKTFENVCRSLHMDDSQERAFHDYINGPQFEGTTEHLGFNQLREIAVEWKNSFGSEHREKGNRSQWGTGRSGNPGGGGSSGGSSGRKRLDDYGWGRSN